MKKIKKLIFETLEISHTASLISQIVSISIILLIIANVIAVILSSDKYLNEQYGNFFSDFETASVLIFTLEFILRIWTCTVSERYKKPVAGRIKYILTPLSVIDLLAILPFYLPMVVTLDLRFLRALRLFRIFRLFKIARYTKALKSFSYVLVNQREKLLTTLFVLTILIVVSASLLYIVENEAQPEVFSSIPHAMWWAVVSLTTVGYGDMYPITTLGKIISSVIMVLSIGLFAIPAGIIASGFTQEEIKEDESKKIICPHCNKEFTK